MKRNGNSNPKIRILKSENLGRRLDDLDFGFRVSDFTLWQLADSAFPTGGFAHSGGLEAAWQHGEVGGRHELVSYIEASLHQLGHANLPFVIAAHCEPDRLEEFDNLCHSFTSNHVANRASRTQGKAFLAAVQRIFFVGRASCFSPSEFPEGNKIPKSDKMPVLRFNHFPCVFGAATRLLGISHEIAAQLFFFNHLRSILAAAVRLNTVGPMEAQKLQHQLAPKAQQVIEICQSLTLNDIAQTSPLPDLWQGTQDRLYSRLFQS